MGVVIAGAALGAVGGIASGLLAGSAKKKAAKKAQATQERLYEAGAVQREAYSQKAQAQADLAQQSLRASEQARFNVASLLGRAGTYDMPQAQGPFQSPLGLGGIGASPRGNEVTSGISAKKSGSVTREDIGSPGRRGAFTGKIDWEEKTELLDPDRLTKGIVGSSQFRTMSRLTAEAEQLANRSGPLWNDLNASVTGGIFASSAAAQRDMLERLSRETAKGGAARRGAVAMANAMRVQENINRQRASLLWDSKTKLEQLRTEMVANTQQVTQNWLNNAAGIRDTFTTNLNNLQTLWASTMAPALVGAQVQAQGQLSASHQQSNKMMMDAINTKFQAISGGVNTLAGGLMSMDFGGGGGPAGLSGITGDFPAGFGSGSAGLA